MAKVLFQSINPHLFRSTFIGYLYEVAQKHQVVLLTEKIDSYTEKILNDKNLFPGLEKIVFFEQAFGKNVLIKNWRLYKTIKKTVFSYKPNIVVVYSDIFPSDMYLLRFAKKIGAMTIAAQTGFKIAEGRKEHLWSCLMNSYINAPRFLPFIIRLFLVKIKKYLGHFFYYWILPFTTGEMPFIGKTSFIFFDEPFGLRDADYSAVFSKREYDLWLKSGMNPEKLFIVGHPLEHKKTKEFFEKVFFLKNKKKEKDKFLTVIWPSEEIGFTLLECPYQKSLKTKHFLYRLKNKFLTGFKNKDYALISKKTMQENRKRIIELIFNKLPDWKIFIKPHPCLKSISKVQSFFESIPKNVYIADPLEPVDKYIKMSKVIIGVPPPSTTLFTASLQCSEKIIISLNLDGEFLGDAYKDFDGIEYINDKEKFIKTLELIKNNKYQKNYQKIKKDKLEENEFKNAIELIDYLYKE